MTKRSAAVAAFILAALLVASCSSGFIGQRSGTIVVATGAAPAARSLTSGWPMGNDTLPVFKDITIEVTDVQGNNMALDQAPIVSGNVITVAVNPGSMLLVSVYAVPDWEATAAKYPGLIIPDLVASFKGTSVANVQPGASAQIAVLLNLESTKILIPDFTTNLPRIYVADGISDTQLEYSELEQLSSYSNYVFGDHGRLFVSTGSGIMVFGSLASAPIETFSPGENLPAMALCKKTNRLYSIDGGALSFIDLDDPERNIIIVTNPVGHFFTGNSIAVDLFGQVYVTSTLDPSIYILKLSIDDPVENQSASTAVIAASIETLNVGYWTGSGEPVFNEIFIADMTIVGNVLYIAASDIYAPTYPLDLVLAKSRGKVIAVNSSSMTVLWETGWCGAETNYPTSDATQFYGPVRFVGFAPKKLYILDEGGKWDGVTTFGNGYSDIDRVVELDLENHIISAIGLSDVSDMYNKYSSYFIC